MFAENSGRGWDLATTEKNCRGEGPFRLHNGSHSGSWNGRTQDQNSSNSHLFLFETGSLYLPFPGSCVPSYSSALRSIEISRCLQDSFLLNAAKKISAVFRFGDWGWFVSLFRVGFVVGGGVGVGGGGGGGLLVFELESRQTTQDDLELYTVLTVIGS